MAASESWLKEVAAPEITLEVEWVRVRDIEGRTIVRAVASENTVRYLPGVWTKLTRQGHRRDREIMLVMRAVHVLEG